MVAPAVPPTYAFVHLQEDVAPVWTSEAMAVDISCLVADSSAGRVFSGSYFSRHPLLCWDSATVSAMRPVGVAWHALF